MEITELNLISDFEAGIKRLQNNPSLISNLSSIAKFPQLNSFWTYIPLIFAVFATFTNIFKKIKILLNHIRLKLLLSYRNSYPKQIFSDVDSDFDFSDDDSSDDFDTPSSVAESDDDDDQQSEDNTNEVFRIEGDNNNINNNNEGYNGNFTLRRRNAFSWSDFSAGKSVVQLWDSFGLGLDFEDDDDENEIAIWDMDREVKLSYGRRVTAAVAAETVVLTAEMGGVSGGGVGFGTYDSRVDGTSPAIYAAWRPRRRNI